MNAPGTSRHWPCFYVNDEIGFQVLKTVKQRLDTYDPDGAKTIWMKNSEIGHYWMARRLINIQLVPNDRQVEQIIHIETQFPTTNFTLSTDTVAKRIQVLMVLISNRYSRAGISTVVPT